jgi:hypothetical protein
VPPFRAAQIVGVRFPFFVSPVHVKDRLKQGDGGFENGLGKSSLGPAACFQDSYNGLRNRALSSGRSDHSRSSPMVWNTDRRDARGQMSLLTQDAHFIAYMDAKWSQPSMVGSGGTRRI